MQISNKFKTIFWVGVWEGFLITDLNMNYVC